MDLHSPASGTDRDVAAIMAKLNAHERSLQALHLDLRDLGHKAEAGFAEVRGEMATGCAGVRRELRGEMAEGFAEMRTGFAITAAGFAALNERFDRLDRTS
ncbi:hypothetical protein [Sporichthya sp.]|uniref:hypothetical protein n=1 Tax=Sporichthya sp. TaxID=65475 RepID=UPI00180DC064|nr:hypothetical protein [Sporichthya sp.]MBA3742286.1 hypothetical protein [Sporichthya sp.]